MESVAVDPRKINLEKTIAFLDGLTRTSQEKLEVPTEEMAEELNNINDKLKLVEQLMEPVDRMCQILTVAHIDLTLRKESIKNLIDNQPKGEEIV